MQDDLRSSIHILAASSSLVTMSFISLVPSHCSFILVLFGIILRYLIWTDFLTNTKGCCCYCYWWGWQMPEAPTSLIGRSYVADILQPFHSYRQTELMQFSFFRRRTKNSRPSRDLRLRCWKRCRRTASVNAIIWLQFRSALRISNGS